MLSSDLSEKIKEYKMDFHICKCKLKLSLCFFLTEHHAKNVYRGVEVWLHAFFDIGTTWR